MSADITRALDTARNVVVEACAGSGKTWLLSSRIARALVEGTPPGAILALTFTNKAAAEMRNRVLGSLKELALADSEKLRAILTSWGLQGAALSQAMQAAPSAFAALIMSPQPPTISTFHSWYSRLAAMAPLSMAGAATMSLSAQPWDLMRKAWQEFFAHGVNDVPYEALVRLLGAHTVRKAMEDWVHARIEWQAFGSRLAGFGAVGRTQAETELAQAQHANASAILAFYEQHRERAAALAKAYAQVEKREDVVALLAAWNPADLDRLSARFLSPIKPKDRSGELPQRFRIKAGNVSLIRQADLNRWGDQAQHTAAEIQALVEALIALLDAMDSRVCQARTQALWICGRRLAQCLDQVMARQHEIDFTGLEAVAWNLMGGESAAAFHARLDTQVQHVLVDEFQDTNPAQWAMLRAWLSQYLQADAQFNAQAPKVFLVGDPKQSIYRFRRADPQVFQVASGWLAENFNAELLQANATRRCGPQVVAFLNDCMPKIAAADRYHAHESLAPKNQGFVRRLPIAADWQQEGAQIAQALLALRGEHPDLEWSQVRILVRARKNMAAYESALLAAGIPYVSDRPGGLLKSPEIRDMIALLRCLAFPWSDADRAQVLNSAIAEPSLRGSQSEPWQSIAQDWFTWASELPVHDLLDRIIHQHDLFSRMAARYGPTRGLQCLANLEAFTALALELDTGRLPSLPRFLQEIHRLAQAKDSDAPGLGIMSAADAVSLSTLHSAKGLEARVVVLAGLLDRDKPDSGLRWLIHWNNQRDRILGVAGWQSGDPYTNTVLHALADDERQARDEDFNLLYVGATRAKQFLIFSATQGAKEADDKWFTRIRPYCEEWVLPQQGPSPHFASGGQRPIQAGWPGQLFDKRDLAQATAAVADTLAIRQGKALHRLLEHGPSLGLQTIERLTAPFALPSFARSSVINALALLKASSPVMEIFRAEYLAYAEAEWPVEQNGKIAVLRPDRVVRMSESPETWWIIDFKWQVLDSERSDYANQLAGYRQAFRMIRPGAAIEAKIVTASAEVWALDGAGELQRLLH